MSLVMEKEQPVAQQHNMTQCSEGESVIEPQKSKAHSFKWWTAVISIIFLYSISIGSYMALVSLTSILNADLGPSPSYTWIAPAWTVAAGTGIIVAGAVSDVLGRRWFCIGTGLLGALGGILGCVAQNVPTAIVAFAFLGLNQAGAINSFAAVAELVSRRHRGYIIGAMNGGSVFWIICGSYLARRMTIDTGPSWRSMFWVTLACNGAGTLVVALTYFPRQPLAAVQGQSYESWLEFDWLGLVGIIIGPALFLVGIQNIPNYGAHNGHFLGPFISGTVAIISLCFYEALVARKPLLHPFLFRQVRSFTAILVVALVGGMLFYSLQAWFPTYLQIVLNEDAVQVGIDTMPMNAGTNLGGVGSAILLPILGPKIGTTSMLTLGVVLQFIFIPLMCVPEIYSRGMALAFSAVAGIGIGIVELLTILLIQLAAPDEWIGFATGSLGLIRMMGGSVGTAIYSAILLSKTDKLVPEYVGQAAVEAGLDPSLVEQLIAILTGVVSTDPLTIKGMNEGIFSAASTAMREAYRESFRYIWLSSIAFAVVSLACALATKDLSPLLTNDVAQELQEANTKQDEEKASTEHIE